MKIGYYVQGDADEAVVKGLAKRWCPDAELAEGKFRGASRESFRREIANSLRDLKSDKRCDILVVLTDADANLWRDVKRLEWDRIPEDCQHLTLFGVADRNIECWMAIDRGALARELKCRVEEIPTDDPSDFIKRHFGLPGSNKLDKDDAKARIRDYVAEAPLRAWIRNSDSFEDFYEDARDLAAQNECSIPNERERGD